MQRDNRAAKSRIVERLHPTCRIVAAAFVPTPKGEGRRTAGEPRGSVWYSRHAIAGLKFHRIEYRLDFRIAIQQLVGEHDVGY